MSVIHTTTHAAQGSSNILAEDRPLPLLLCKQSALLHNVTTMQRYCDEVGVLLAPHGKTTMCPSVWEAQLAAGAWGITAATAQQARACFSAGVRRVVLANEVVGAPNLDSLAHDLAEDADRELYLWVDSRAGVEALAYTHARHVLAAPWNVLIEIGYSDGRAGVRGEDELADVIAALTSHADRLTAVGLAFFEGPLQVAGRERITPLLRQVAETAQRLEGQGLLPADYILSAGGSKAFDLVVDVFRTVPPPVRVVLRSGCYVTHDHGNDARLSPLGAVAASQLAEKFGRLMPALELWAYVVSAPESSLAILGFGRREASFDAGLPTPVAAVRAGCDLTPWTAGEVVRLDDQHAYLRVHGDALAVGDRVVLGISHPCTAIDKWRSLVVVDDAYNVIDEFDTCFS